MIYGPKQGIKNNFEWGNTQWYIKFTVYKKEVWIKILVK